MIPYVENM